MSHAAAVETPPPAALPPAVPPAACRVRDIMSRRVFVARDHDTLAFASQLMLWRGIRHLPVVDEQERLVGIVSDRDLMRYVVEGPAGSLPLRDVMSSPVETIRPDADVDEASGRLSVAKIDCLPVVSNTKVLGILTTFDVLAERAKRLHKGGSGRTPTAGDLMSRRVVVAHCGDTLVSAIQKLIDAGVRHVPIVDDDHRLVGILSDRDVRTVVGDPREAILRGDDDPLAAVEVDSVMTARPRSVSPDASVLELAELFVDHRIGAVPVVTSDDKLLGIISYVDVIGHFAGRRFTPATATPGGRLAWAKV